MVENKMELNFARPLYTNELAFYFLKNTLGLDEKLASYAALRVMGAENNLLKMGLNSTLKSQDYRNYQYKSDESRVILRHSIFNELIVQKRLNNDDDIKSKVGGAQPIAALQSKKQVIILTGLPASGKSLIANTIADIYGAYIIDSDYAKRKLPEFEDNEWAASILHEESSLVVFGCESHEQYSQELSLYEFCISKGFNMVMPTIGDCHEKLRKTRDTLIEKGYKVHLILISLDRKESCRRVLNRFLDTKRYVPLGNVFDVYGNEPILSYYRTKNDKQWSSVGKLSTSELKEKGFVVVFSDKKSSVNKLRERGVIL
jgi:Zeta toxin